MEVDHALGELDKCGSYSADPAIGDVTAEMGSADENGAFNGGELRWREEDFVFFECVFFVGLCEYFSRWRLGWHVFGFDDGVPEFFAEHSALDR